jgi:hypothetical protein
MAWAWDVAEFYTDATKRSPIGYGYDGARGSPLSAYGYGPVLPPYGLGQPAQIACR